MITYVASVAALAEEPETQKAHGPAIEEILKAFSTFFLAVPEASRKYERIEDNSRNTDVIHQDHTFLEFSFQP